MSDYNHSVKSDTEESVPTEPQYTCGTNNDYLVGLAVTTKNGKRHYMGKHPCVDLIEEIHENIMPYDFSPATSNKLFVETSPLFNRFQTAFAGDEDGDPEGIDMDVFLSQSGLEELLDFDFFQYAPFLNTELLKMLANMQKWVKGNVSMQTWEHLTRGLSETEINCFIPLLANTGCPIIPASQNTPSAVEIEKGVKQLSEDQLSESTWEQVDMSSSSDTDFMCDDDLQSEEDTTLQPNVTLIGPTTNLVSDDAHDNATIIEGVELSETFGSAEPTFSASSEEYENEDEPKQEIKEEPTTRKHTATPMNTEASSRCSVIDLTEPEDTPSSASGPTKRSLKDIVLQLDDEGNIYVDQNNHEHNAQVLNGNVSSTNRIYSNDGQTINIHINVNPDSGAFQNRPNEPNSLFSEFRPLILTAINSGIALYGFRTAATTANFLIEHLSKKEEPGWKMIGKGVAKYLPFVWG